MSKTERERILAELLSAVEENGIEVLGSIQEVVGGEGRFGNDRHSFQVEFVDPVPDYFLVEESLIAAIEVLFENGYNGRTRVNLIMSQATPDGITRELGDRTLVYTERTRDAASQVSNALATWETNGKYRVGGSIEIVEGINILVTT